MSDEQTQQPTEPEQPQPDEGGEDVGSRAHNERIGQESGEHEPGARQVPMDDTPKE